MSVGKFGGRLIFIHKWSPLPAKIVIIYNFTIFNILSQISPIFNKINMMKAGTLDDPMFYLQNAKYFNGLWHEQMDLLLSNSIESETQQILANTQAKLYLAQKRDCQLTALHMVYDEAMQEGYDYSNCGMILEIDPNEKGVSGDEVYYGLYPMKWFGLACHIPKHELLEGLTHKECQFFGLI